MRAKLMLSAALTIVLASAGGAFAQSMQYDRTGDHMVSYGPLTPAPLPTTTHVRASRHHARAQAASTMQVPIDRTSDHMLYYGPVAQ